MPRKPATTDRLLKQILSLFPTSGLSQAELARKAGVSKNTVSQYFATRRGINTIKASAILDVLEKHSSVTAEERAFWETPQARDRRLAKEPPYSMPKFK